MLQPTEHRPTRMSHSGQVKCDSRQTGSSKPDCPDGIVSPQWDLRPNLPPVVYTSNRPVCHQVQQQTSLFVSPVPDKEA